MTYSKNQETSIWRLSVFKSTEQNYNINAPPPFPWSWLPLKEQLLIPDLIGHLEIIAKMNYGNMKQWQTVLFRPTKSAEGNDWNSLEKKQKNFSFISNYSMLSQF